MAPPAAPLAGGCRAVAALRPAAAPADRRRRLLSCSAGSRSRSMAASRPTSGASHWISGQEDIVHTHRLRALFDAVVVGAGTVRADDPQLTTREVEGPSPVRVVLDTDRRLRRATIACSARRRRRCCSAPPMPPASDRMGEAPVLRLPRARRGAGHRRRARALAGARTAAHLRRRRRHHRVALPRRGRARSPACDDRAAADRLRHSRLHPAGSDDADRGAALRLVGASRSAPTCWSISRSPAMRPGAQA